MSFPVLAPWAVAAVVFIFFCNGAASFGVFSECDAFFSSVNKVPKCSGTENEHAEYQDFVRQIAPLKSGRWVVFCGDTNCGSCAFSAARLLSISSALRQESGICVAIINCAATTSHSELGQYDSDSSLIVNIKSDLFKEPAIFFAQDGVLLYRFSSKSPWKTIKAVWTTEPYHNDSP